MEKHLVFKFLLLVGIIFIFCQNAQAGLFDSLSSQISQVVKNDSNNQQQNSQTAQQQAASGITNNAPTGSSNNNTAQEATSGISNNAQIDIPQVQSGINDFAGVISQEDKDKLTASINEFEQKTPADIVVVTVGSTEPLDAKEYTKRLLDSWKPEKNDKDNSVLVFLAVKESFFQIESGSKLENILSDQVEGDITDNVVFPYFKTGNLSDGLYYGVNKIIDTIHPPENQTLVDLEKGAFGIPLKSGIQDIAKWCLDNNVTVSNTTKQQAEDYARKILGEIKEIKSSYDTSTANLSDMQKDLLKEFGPNVDGEEKLFVDQANKALDVLKNPTFDYQGETYYLEPSLEDGMQVSIGGVNKTCTDSRITQSIYSLVVVPSEKSDKLLNNSVDSVQIFFKRDSSGNLGSYLTLASFKNQDSESVDAFTKQYETMTKILTDKYDTPAYQTDWTADPTGQGMAQSIQNSDSPEFVLYHLTGNFFDNFDALLWRKNVLLITQFFGHTENKIDDRYPMYLIYYDPSTANQIIESHKQAIQDFGDQSTKEEANKENQMKQDF